MYNLLLINLQISLDDLVHEMQTLVLCHFDFDFFIQVALAELGDYVSVVFGGINFVECQDIGDILEFFEYLNF
jgi:hypothetical protein